MKHIALVFGGPSAEHDVSLVSAKNIYQVLKETQLKVTLLGVTKTRDWKLIQGEDLLKTNFITPIDLDQLGIPVQLKRIEKDCFLVSTQDENEKIGPIDVAFPIIHGPFGEDGELQSIFNEFGLAFVGSDFLSCENSFDKEKTKRILKEKGVSQAPYLTFTDENPHFKDVENKLGLPFFVKPANMGSSIGISKVKSEADFGAALAEARIHDKKIVIEKGIVGREIETALLEDEGELKISGLGEVRPLHEFYSYEAKYLDDKGAELIIPADVDPTPTETIKDLALNAFRSLGCRDFARADFFLTPDGEVYFNEINTHPGCTNISQFPMLWKEAGINYKELILKLINNALKRKIQS